MTPFFPKLWIALPMLLLVAGCEKITSPSASPQAVVVPAPSLEASPQQQLSQAVVEIEQKNYGNAIKITMRVSQVDPNNTESYVIEAQAKSQSGDPKAALAALENALQHGFSDVARLMREQRLDAVRALPEFPEALRRHGLAAPITGTEISAGDVSIKDDGKTQVIQSGDITLRVPKN